MKKDNEIKKFHIYSFIFVSILGTLSHFLFQFSNNNFIIGAFVPVNESVWEHLKLIFFPMIISSAIGYFTLKNKPDNYICSRVKGILIAMCFIVVFFYTYSGIIGKSIAIIDILSFYVGVFLGEYISYQNIIIQKECNKKKAMYIVIILFICFVLFTYFPLKLGIFEDPVTSSYGIVLEEK